jgi:hypothetical protein
MYLGATGTKGGIKGPKPSQGTSTHTYSYLMGRTARFIELIRKNQLPVSAVRWQVVGQICFAAFIWRKLQRMEIIQ